MSKIIPDISHWQGEVDFEKMKSAGASAVIFKASQYYEDKNYKANVAGVKGILPYAAYHYYDNTIDPNVQAQKFASVLDGTEKFLIADYEDRLPGNYSGWKKLYTFLVKLQELVPNKKIVIYSTYYYWKENSPQAFWQKSSLDWFGQFKFWYAAYNTRTWVEQLIPKPWTHEDTLMWQHTDKGDGVKYGVSSLNIDLNYWTRTEEEFVEYFGEEEIPEPPPVEEPPTEETTVIITYQSDNPVNFIFVDANVTPPEPPAPIPVEMQLVKKEGKAFAVIHRTPDDGEVHKIQLDFIEGATIKTLDIPKNRIMMRDDGTTHEVPNWETEADFHNLNAVWAFLPIQEVQKSNLNFRMLHNAWTDSGSKGNWDTMGSYILRVYLKEIGEPEPPTFEFRVPSTGNFVYVNHDWGSQYWHYQPRSAPMNNDTRKDNGDIPDTGKGRVDRFNPMPKDWQFLWRDVARYFAPDMHDVYDVNDFLSFPVAMESLMADTRAITDNHAAENGYINYVTGKNLSDPYGKGDLQVKEMMFGGIIGKVLEETTDTYILEAFDMSKPAPTLEEVLRDYPHLIGWTTTTQCYRIDDKWDGIESAKPFPQIRDKNNKRTGTPYLVTGLGGRIEMRKTSATRKCLDLSPIANGSGYFPYKYRS